MRAALAAGALWAGPPAWCGVADEIFARVALWWDRSAMLSDKRALLAYVNAAPRLSEKWWEELDGQLRWRLVDPCELCSGSPASSRR